MQLTKWMTATSTEDAYKAAVEKGKGLIKSCGYKADEVAFIPVSGWKGDNLGKKI